MAISVQGVVGVKSGNQSFRRAAALDWLRQKRKIGKGKAISAK